LIRRNDHNSGIKNLVEKFVDEIEALAEDEAKLLPKDLIAAIEYVKEIDLTSGNKNHYISKFINFRISRMQSKNIENQKRTD
jgi:hypothetical protein